MPWWGSGGMSFARDRCWLYMVLVGSSFCFSFLFNLFLLLLGWYGMICSRVVGDILRTAQIGISVQGSAEVDLALELVRLSRGIRLYYTGFVVDGIFGGQDVSGSGCERLKLARMVDVVLRMAEDYCVGFSWDVLREVEGFVQEIMGGVARGYFGLLECFLRCEDGS